MKFVFFLRGVFVLNIKCFYINLDRSHGRRVAIESDFQKISPEFQVERFTAVDGSTEARLNDHLSPGQTGCYLSHMRLIHANLGSESHLMIVEDDESFNSKLENIGGIISQVPEVDWDIIYLDFTVVEIEDMLYLTRCLHNNINHVSNPKIIPLPKWFTPYGTHAYIVNYRFKEKLYEVLNSNKDAGLPIDNILCLGLRQSVIRSFATLPFLCYPGVENSNSQIVSTEHPLASSWESFRTGISVKADNNLSNLEFLTKQVVQSRLNFHPLSKFEPLIRSAPKA